MSYHVSISRDADGYLTKLPSTLQVRIATRLRRLSEDPFHRDTKALTNEAGLRSVRVGHLRIIYHVDADAQFVEIRRISPRGQVYRNLDD